MPVNEYKIADKIIAANKSLFEANEEIKPENAEEKNNMTERNRPRVTFSSDIEEYGDEDNDSIHSNENESAMESADDEKGEKHVAQELPALMLLQNDANEEYSKSETNQASVEDKSDLDIKIDDAPSEPVETIEEICEDIDVIKLEPAMTEHEPFEEIIEEIDENIPASISVNPDSEPCKHTESAGQNDGTFCDKKEEDNSTQSVAMDIPIESDTPKPRKIRNVKSAPETTKKPESKTNMRKTSLNSVVQKGNLTPQKSQNIKKSKSFSTIESARDDDLLKIQLNFKCCCEHKYLENDRLPRYKGYFSQYGLSKEELEERAARKEEMRKMKYENWLRKKEEKQMKSQINEHAYAQWLKEKLRTVRNKEKNMFNENRQKQKRTNHRVQHTDCWK